jgi:Protein of unknown function (DUF3078)
MIHIRRLFAAVLLTAAVSSPAIAQFTPGTAPEAPKAPVPAGPQAGPWKFQGTAKLNLSQSAYSSNWMGGDQGNWVWVARFDGRAERQASSSFNTLNTLVLAYGQTGRQQADAADPSQRVWDTPDKTTDQIEFESVARFTLGAFADPYGALRMDTQFLDQSQPNGSLTLTPVRIKLSAGLARVLVKDADREIITRFGFGGRVTAGNVFSEAPPSTRTQSYSNTDAGLEWVTTAHTPLLGKKVMYKGTLGFFQPVTYSQSSALEDYDAIAAGLDPGHEPIADYWKTTDINFENTFTAKITENFGVELMAQLVYNKFDSTGNVDTSLPTDVLIPQTQRNVRLAGQFRQTLALSLSYRLF